MANKLTLNEDLFEEASQTKPWTKLSGLMAAGGDKSFNNYADDEIFKVHDIRWINPRRGQNLPRKVDITVKDLAPFYSGDVFNAIRSYLYSKYDARISGLGYYQPGSEPNNDEKLIDWVRDHKDIEQQYIADTIESGFSIRDITDYTTEDLADWMEEHPIIVKKFVADFGKKPLDFLDESLNEDYDLAPQEPSEETPKTPEANGVAKLLLKAINDESDTIQEYNDLIANTDNEDIIRIIQDITAEENNHIGMLQRALEIISPNASNIEDGVEEAEGMIDEEEPKDEIEIINVDDEIEEHEYPFGESLDEKIDSSKKVKIGNFYKNDFVLLKHNEVAQIVGDDGFGGYKIKMIVPEPEEGEDYEDYYNNTFKSVNDRGIIRVLDNNELSDIMKKEYNESLNEASKAKSWVIFFDEDGNNPVGSDGSKPMSVMPAQADKIIQSGNYSIPKWAKSYVIITQGQFEMMSYKDLEKYRDKYAKPINESLTEDLHSKFKKEIKNAYKDWAKKVEAREAKIKEFRELIPEDASQEKIDMFMDKMNDIYPPVADFKFDFPHNIEKDDYPFYVTYYAEYPIYEPAEGGYYYAGRDAIFSNGFETEEEAQKWMDAYVENESNDFGETWDKYTDGYTCRGQYIGEDQIIKIEPRNAYLSEVKGWEPYQ